MDYTNYRKYRWNVNEKITNILKIHLKYKIEKI